ncbi:hypothetical protein PDJAM_G00235460, partial [Pangasius djambal]|nr:hypothetical protein [Pangasius djambal]
ISKSRKRFSYELLVFCLCTQKHYLSLTSAFIFARCSVKCKQTACCAGIRGFFFSALYSFTQSYSFLINSQKTSSVLVRSAAGGGVRKRVAHR